MKYYTDTYLYMISYYLLRISYESNRIIKLEYQLSILYCDKKKKLKKKEQSILMKYD